MPLGKLIFHLFSSRQDSMRYWHGRRLLAVFLFGPIFMWVLLINRFFLLLDDFLFPAYRDQEVPNPVFIVAAPRSGTTFLYHSLAKEKEYFTCIKLWEIVFAPAICQKYFFLLLARLDRRWGSPLRRFLKGLERRRMGKLRRIHLIGLFLPEEDEALLLWYLNSNYLHYFFPDVLWLDELLYFDERLAPARRAHIMATYRRLVQRHNYVFNPQARRRYLAKNPLFMNRLGSLNRAFPSAKVLTIIRCPSRVIPSTLSLNAFLYRFFSARSIPRILRDRSIDLLLRWYEMAHEALANYYPQAHLCLDFGTLVQRDPATFAAIRNFLKLSPASLPASAIDVRQHRSGQTYLPLNPKQLQEIMTRHPFLASVLSAAEKEAFTKAGQAPITLNKNEH